MKKIVIAFVFFCSFTLFFLVGCVSQQKAANFDNQIAALESKVNALEYQLNQADDFEKRVEKILPKKYPESYKGSALGKLEGPSELKGSVQGVMQ